MQSLGLPQSLGLGMDFGTLDCKVEVGESCRFALEPAPLEAKEKIKALTLRVEGRIIFTLNVRFSTLSCSFSQRRRSATGRDRMQFCGLLRAPAIFGCFEGSTRSKSVAAPGRHASSLPEADYNPKLAKISFSL